MNRGTGRRATFVVMGIFGLAFDEWYTAFGFYILSNKSSTDSVSYEIVFVYQQVN